MSRRQTLLLGVGCLSALLLAALWFSGGRDPGRLERSDPPDPTRTGGRKDQPLQPRPEAPRPGEPVGSAPASRTGQPGRGFFGQVIRPDGEPVAGADVRAFPLAHRPTADLVPFPVNPLAGKRPAARARTDTAGRFRLAPGPGIYRLTARHRSGSSRVTGPLGLTAGGKHGPLTLVLMPQFQLAGRTVDASGKPVAGATVTLLASNHQPVPPQHRTSDTRGRFRFLVPAGDHALRVAARGFIPLLYPDLRAPDERLSLVLQRGGGIVGRVETTDGEPVADARVEGVLGDWHGATTSDDAGRFGFPQVPPGDALLTVTHPRYAPAQRSVRTRRGAGVAVRVQLRAGLTLEGRVLDPSDSPLAGVEVLARPLEASVMTVPTATSDESGAIRLAGLHKGSHTLWLRGPRHTLARPVEVFVHPDRANRVTLRAVPLARLSGTVVDSRDNPLAGARLRILPPTPGTPWLVRTAFSDAEGQFRMPIPVLGSTFQLEVEHRDQVGVYFGPLRLAAGERKQVRIQLPEAAAVAGRVSTDEGQPLGGAMLTLFAIGKDGTRSRVSRTTAGPQGSYHFGRLHPATRYQLRIEARGRRTSLTGVFDVTGGDVRTLDITLPGARQLTGSILTPTGQPVVGALVEAVDEPSGGFLSRARTDHTGRFRLDGLSDGPYALSAFAPGYREVSRSGVAAGAALELQMARERTISVEVELPIDYHFDYTIQLFPEGKPKRVLQPVFSQAFAPNQRRHILGPLPEGRYKLVARGPGLVPFERDGIAALGEGGSVQYLQLRLGRMIVGKLVDEKGGPINGAFILRGRVAPTVSAAEAQARGLILEATHPDGDFHLTGFEGAQTTITVMHPAYLTMTVTVEVGEQARNRVVMRPGHRLRVRVTGGKPSGRELRLEGPVVRQMLTDASGVTTFGGLQPGEYKILIDGAPSRHGAIKVPEMNSIVLKQGN